MNYTSLQEPYKNWLAQYGDTPSGVGWSRAEQVPIRYRVMMEVIKKYPTSILDFGCGPAGLLDHIKLLALTGVDYYGLDILPESIEIAKNKHPESIFLCGDILKNDYLLSSCPVSYVIINGIFTYKHTLSFEEMWEFAQVIISKLFAIAHEGLAVNFMSKTVDWEKEYLFHVPISLVTDFITQKLTRHYVVRHDYQLREYTTYLYKE